jgi:TP901 family phage tail tape measure protein
MASRELNILIKAKNLAGPAIAGVKKELGSISKDIGKGLSSAGKNIERGIALGVTAAGGAMAYAVKQAGDFQASLNTINTVAGVTPKQLDAIGSSIRGLARKTGTPLEDLSGAYYDLVSAGISAADAQDVLTQANTLAIGGLSSTGEAVDLLTTAINSYGGDASKAKQFTDQFAVAIANGKVTAAELAANFADVGPLAAAMGIGVDQISASIGNMTAKGTKAPEAFTQIRAAMVALQRQTPDLKKVLKKLGIKNVEKELGKKGLAGTWQELAKEADKLGIPLIKLTGRVEGQQYVLQNTGDNWKGYADNLADVKKASDGAGEAAKQMAERQKGLNFQLDRLKANAKDAAITLGEAIIPKILPLFEKANAWLDTHQDDVKKFAENVASGVAKAVEWAGSLDWEGIGKSLKTAAEFSKGLVEAFLSMPDWVKQAVITGWGLNKLTGGALGSIAGKLVVDAGEAIGKSLLQKLGLMNVNAAVVNVKGGIVNGGPGGGLPTTGPTGPGGGGNWLTKLVPFLISRGTPVAAAVSLTGPANRPDPEDTARQGALGQIAAEGNFTPAQQALVNQIRQLGDQMATGPHGGPEFDALLKKQQALEDQLIAISSAARQQVLGQKTTDGILARNASEHNRVVTQTNAKLAQLNQHASSNAAKTMAMLASSREAAAKLAAIPPHLAKIAGADLATSANTAAISRKNFSPHVTTNVSVSAKFNVSVKDVVRSTSDFHISQGQMGGMTV